MKTLKLAGLVILVSAVAGLITATIVPSSNETASIHREQRHVFLDFAHAGDAIVAVGEQGQIWRSTDGGESWTKRPSGTDRLLTAVDFANDSVGLAVGHFGTVLHSNDGGKSWQQVPLDLVSAQEFVALDVAFVDEQDAYIVGSAERILRSRDGGLSWQDDKRASSARPDLNAISILPSGRAMVVASDGSMFIKSAQNEDIGWELLPEQTRNPLYGIVQMGADDAVLVYGAEGTILQSADGGASWEVHVSASKAAYYTGIRSADGSVILAGDQGIMVRRAPGANGFYLEETLPRDTVVDLTQTSDGTLLLAGVQGLRSAGGEYQFVGDDQGLTGHWRTLQLQHLTETRFLLARTAAQAYYDEDPEMAEAINQDWLALDLVARNGGSLLEPALFSEIRHFYLNLSGDSAFSAYSLWSSDLLLPSVNAGAEPLMAYVGRDYDEMESEALLQRIQRAGVEGVLISKDRSRISFYVEPKDEPAAREFASTHLEDLQSMHNRDLESGYEVQLSRVLNLSTASPTATDADENAYFVYVLAVRESYYRSCDLAPYAELAHKLDASLREMEGIQTSLSFADMDKWSNVLAHRNWKWFSTGVPDYQRSPSTYGEWLSHRCVNTLAIVYGASGGQNASQAIKEAIEAIAGPEMAQQIAVTPYLMTAIALAEPHP